MTLKPVCSSGPTTPNGPVVTGVAAGIEVTNGRNWTPQPTVPLAPNFVTSPNALTMLLEPERAVEAFPDGSTSGAGFLGDVKPDTLIARTPVAVNVTGLPIAVADAPMV